MMSAIPMLIRTKIQNTQPLLLAFFTLLRDRQFGHHAPRLLTGVPTLTLAGWTTFGRPQPGQAGAASDVLRPQSGHLMRPIQ